MGYYWRRATRLQLKLMDASANAAKASWTSNISDAQVLTQVKLLLQ
jgi:hypothetical protein